MNKKKLTDKIENIMEKYENLSIKAEQEGTAAMSFIKEFDKLNETLYNLWDNLDTEKNNEDK